MIEQLTATLTIDAPADAVFRVLADPTTHPVIDGTGWVVKPVDPDPLTADGQLFRMDMYFDNPEFEDGNYRIANRVNVFDVPQAIGWLPGQEGADGEVHAGGWSWRYDLVPVRTGRTAVTLTYDWSHVPGDVRAMISFPAADSDHLNNSLQHLARLVTS